MTGTACVTYACTDGIATITMDDRKANALSLAMQHELAAALDRAEADEAIVVLTGGGETFCAGFDLRAAAGDWPAMVAGGGRLAERMLAFPHPVIVACNGNAIAMGAFLLTAADVRIGVASPCSIGFNEVRLGLPMTRFGMTLARYRLTPPYADRCVVTGVLLSPEEALAAGFLDQLVSPEELGPAARAAGDALEAVDRAAHTATKRKLREAVLGELRAGIERIRTADTATW